MSCCLDGAKLLSEPMLEYCWFDPWEQTSVKYLSQNLYFLIQENAFEIVVGKLAAILSLPQCIKESFIQISQGQWVKSRADLACEVTSGYEQTWRTFLITFYQQKIDGLTRKKT